MRDNLIFRNNSNKIIVSNLVTNNEVTEKKSKPLNKELLDNELSVRSITNRILWLDADDINTITTSGNYITRWYDKTFNGNYTESSGEYGAGRRPQYYNDSIDLGYIQRGCIKTNGSQGFTLGQQLDSFIVGPNKQWTSILAIKPTQFNNDDTFVEVVTKYGDNSDDLGFTFYIYDKSIGNKEYRSEFYNEGSLYDGCNIIGNTNIGQDKPYIFTNVYSATSGNNSLRMKQNINREFDNKTINIFGNGLTANVIDNHVPLCLAYSYEGNGYSGFIGDIYEWLIFSRVLNDREIAAVENYLTIKWGIAQYIPKFREGI